MNVDLPAFGMPSRPTSASTFSSSLSSRRSPSLPSVFWRGARLVVDLKCMLPQPPSPPLASSTCWPCSVRSATISPSSASMISVPTGMRSDDVVGALAIAVGAAAVLAVARLVQLGVAVVDQRIDVAVGDRPDAAALAAVAAVGTAERDGIFRAGRTRSRCRRRRQ